MEGRLEGGVGPSEGAMQGITLQHNQCGVVDPSKGARASKVRMDAEDDATFATLAVLAFISSQGRGAEVNSVGREEGISKPFSRRVVVHVWLGVGLGEGKNGREGISDARADYVFVAEDSHDILGEDDVTGGYEEGWRGSRVCSVYATSRRVVGPGTSDVLLQGSESNISGAFGQPRPQVCQSGLEFGGRGGGTGGLGMVSFGFAGCAGPNWAGARL